MIRKISNYFFFLLVICASYWAIKPFFISGFFPMHDDTQPSRVYEMARALSFGQFPVRWVADLGYGFGYPIFNFYAPLPYYLGGVFNLFGLSAILATKIMFIIGILLAGIGMYFLFKEISGKIAGLAGALLYVYAPYHAVNIYVRGAVGELYAYGFLPFLLLGIYKLMRNSNEGKRKKEGIILSALAFAGILLSHNILGLLTGFFLLLNLAILFIYFILKKKPLKMLYSLIFAIFLSLGLSAFFTLPAIGESKYTRVEELKGGGSDFRQHFVYPDQLWNSPWGFGGSTAGRSDGMSFKIGKVHLLLGLISFFMAPFLFLKKQPDALIFKFYLIVFSLLVISVFLMLQSSQFIWEKIPWSAYVQYPWRFLNFTLLGLVTLTSVLFLKLKRWFKLELAVVIVGITFWFNVKYFIPKEIRPLLDEDYTNTENLRFKISKISDEYLPPNFVVPQKITETVKEAVIGNEEIGVKKVKETPTEKIYQISSNNFTPLLTNIAFFPGWELRLDGKKKEIFEENGRIRINLPSGSHKISFRLKDTPLRFTANMISLFSLFLIVYLSLFKGKKCHDEKEFH